MPNNERKAGTFWCWLFGHKFVLLEFETNAKGWREYTMSQARFCVRCGASRIVEGKDAE